MSHQPTHEPFERASDGLEISLRGLRKSFGARRALDGVDLELVGPGIVGIVGPDGAGKTTLLRSLVGLMEIEAERAQVLGHDLRGDVTALKAEIGYVPQSFGLQRDLSVFENLRFTARLKRLRDNQFERRAGELLERTGLARFRDRFAGQLSGGMKQKLAIANALLQEPRLIILDEPTAGVDVVARDEIWELLVSARSEALVLVSTSYLDEAASCDRLIYLDHGRVLAQGAPDELRAAVAVDLYRVWGEPAREIARAARALPYVVAASARGNATRIEVAPDRVRERALSQNELLGQLMALTGGVATFAEAIPVDMEATLLHFARTQGVPGAPRSAP